MGLDDFQLFNERKKRRPLGDVTNRKTPAGIDKISKFKSFLTRSLPSKESLITTFGIKEQQYNPLKQQNVTVKSSNLLKHDMKNFKSIPIQNSISLDSGIKRNTLILNLKRVLVDSSFSKNEQPKSSYFEFVHSLSQFNAITAKSNAFIKDFANRQRLHQLRSTQAAPTSLSETSACKKTKPQLIITVKCVSKLSEFIVAVSSLEHQDCLLLNTLDYKVTTGVTLTLEESKIYNLNGKDIPLYTKWKIQR